MRIAVIAVGCLLLIAATVVALGALLPMRHSVSRSATYRASPEQLFTLIEGSQNWRPDVTHFEVAADNAGRQLQRETTRDGETIAYELEQINPPISVKRRIATDNLPYGGTWSFSLQAEGGTTRVRICEDGEVYNPVFRVVSRYIIGQHRTIDAYLTALGGATGQDIQITDLRPQAESLLHSGRPRTSLMGLFP